MTMHKPAHREGFPPRWAFFVLALVMIFGLGWLLYNQVTTTADKNVAQANSQTLAQDIQTICNTHGKLVVDDRDICAKAEQVQEKPTEAIPGPKGDPGKEGPKGETGATGAKGDPGIAGKNGTNGTNGAPGATGATGAQGEQGVPGEPGAQGEKGIPGEPGATGATGPQGPQGEPGQDVDSFTFDWAGQTYTCTPNPPESSTFTCTSDRAL